MGISTDAKIIRIAIIKKKSYWKNDIAAKKINGGFANPKTFSTFAITYDKPFYRNGNREG